MSIRHMKPLLLILGFALVFALLGWGWSELPRTPQIFAPTWTRSYNLYQQPHAVWLSRDEAVGANKPLLLKVLSAAAKTRQIPELVVYSIPLRDLGQSSEGGFATYEDYMADNRLNADLVKQFVDATHLHPVIYLEPDSLPLALQYRLDRNNDAESNRIYSDRVNAIGALVTLYQDAGAQVYLEAGHSDWFDYGNENVQRIATILNEANIRAATGVATNISNRQPITGRMEEDRSEAHYVSRLVPLLDLKNPDVRVDTSRNGGSTHARQYYLSPDGRLMDNESVAGRLVGNWETITNQAGQEETWIHPFFGKPKLLARLLAKEKYTYNAERRILIAPKWLDAVGDVKLGPAPTDTPPQAVASTIQHYRYIKPPDDCDGALNCPPGASKHDINEDTAKHQPEPKLSLPPRFWLGRVTN